MKHTDNSNIGAAALPRLLRTAKRRRRDPAAAIAVFLLWTGLCAWTAAGLAAAYGAVSWVLSASIDRQEQYLQRTYGGER